MDNDIQVFNSKFYDPTGTGIVFAKSRNENEKLFSTNYAFALIFNKPIGTINKQIKKSQHIVQRVYGKKFHKVRMKGSNGRPKDFYFMDEELANYLLDQQQNTSYNGISMREIKARFHKAFYDSKSINLERKLTHKISKPVTKSMHDAIKENTTLNSRYDHTNIEKLVYKTALNKSTNQIRREKGIPKGKKVILFGYLSINEQLAVSKVKTAVIGLISLNLGYQDIVQALSVVKNKIIIDRPKQAKLLPMVIQ